jgi:hypothetical protein
MASARMWILAGKQNSVSETIEKKCRGKSRAHFSPTFIIHPLEISNEF